MSVAGLSAQMHNHPNQRSPGSWPRARRLGLHHEGGQVDVLRELHMVIDLLSASVLSEEEALELDHQQLGDVVE
jgi:hypothetical protein